jgi:hypothetical protein
MGIHYRVKEHRVWAVEDESGEYSSKNFYKKEDADTHCRELNHAWDVFHADDEKKKNDKD